MQENYKTKVQNNELPSIDSFKIRIPFPLVEVKNKNLTSKWILVNEDTGEQDETYFKENSYKVEENGIKIHFALEKQQTAKQSVQEFLTILLPAKILKQRYFEGITANNLKLIYDELMKMNVVSFSYDSFINGECTDVDFKLDRYMDMEAFEDIKQSMYKHTKPSVKAGNGARLFNEKSNKGIQWSDRKTTSYKSNPYLKMYHKEIELINKSFKFSNSYLSGFDYSDLVRTECTVKNKAHFRYLGINDTTLRTLTELSSESLKRIIRTTIARQLEQRIHKIHKHSELKPEMMIRYNFIVALMNTGLSYELIRDEIALSGMDNKNEKSRKKKQLNELYKNYIRDSKLDKTTKKAQEFYSIIGWE